MKKLVSVIITAATVFSVFKTVKVMAGTRGMRNNNPGNLKISSIPWVGKVPVSNNTDGIFEQFIAKKYGIRAMIKDLLKDIQTDGQDTLQKLIPEYAPHTENATDLYISFLETETGLKSTSTLKTDKDSMYKLVKAIAKYENGKDIINYKEFSEAWQII